MKDRSLFQEIIDHHIHLFVLALVVLAYIGQTYTVTDFPLFRLPHTEVAPGNTNIRL